MTEIPNIVKQIDIIAKSGLYGSPRKPEFMDAVFQNHFTNISSPIKAEAFAKYYKLYGKGNKNIYKPMGKITGTSPLKKLLKAKKMKKTKKEQKEDTNMKKAALAAKKAKEAYMLSMYGPNYVPPKKSTKKIPKSSVKHYSPASSTTSSKSSKSSKSSSKSSMSSKASTYPSKTSSASSASSYMSR